jgi:hypothetical protein
MRVAATQLKIKKRYHLTHITSDEANSEPLWPQGTVAGQFSSGFASTYRHASMGFIGGLQGGYNWQIGGLLLGVEGDYNGVTRKTRIRPAEHQFRFSLGAVLIRGLSTGPYPTHQAKAGPAKRRSIG